MTRLKRPPSVEDAGTTFVIAANYDVGEFRLAMRTVASQVAILTCGEGPLRAGQPRFRRTRASK
jgi:hypothetical protein